MKFGHILKYSDNLGLHIYGFTIGPVHITWLDVWTMDYGLWIEWEHKPKRLISNKSKL